MSRTVRYSEEQWRDVVTALGDVSGSRVAVFPGGQISFTNLEILRRSDLAGIDRLVTRDAEIADYRLYLEGLLTGIFGTEPSADSLVNRNRLRRRSDLDKAVDRLEDVLADLGLREIADAHCTPLRQISEQLKSAVGKRGPKPDHRWEMLLKAVVDLWIGTLSRSATSSPTGPLIKLVQACAAPIAADIGLSTYGPDRDARKLIKERASRPASHIFNRLDAVVQEAALRSGLQKLSR